jgi:ABC-type glycerol-3-phosphate transport system substrate-binding protein
MASAQQNSASSAALLNNLINTPVNNYVSYVAGNLEKKQAQTVIELPSALAQLTDGAKGSYAVGNETNVLELPENGAAEWSIQSNEDALFNLRFEYYPLTGRLNDIEIKLEIDGKVPFEEAQSINLSRIFKPANAILKDNNNNDIRPKQVEAPEWLSEYIYDKNGYVNSLFAFYLSKGEHKVKITLMRDTIALKALFFETDKTIKTYSEVKSEYPNLPVIEDYYFKRQAEDLFRTSHAMIYATDDQGTPAIQPSSPSKIRLNTIGLINWDKGGQWASWKFEVKEDGLYHINLKYRQSTVRGFSTTRKVYIDNEVTFKELEKVDFAYTSGQNWVNKTLADDKGDPYLFYLKKGTHTLKLEVTTGELGPILYEVKDIVYKLNELYRQIIMVTGTSPDPLNDYYLDEVIPEFIPTLKAQSANIKRLMKKLNALSTDKSGTQANFMLEIANQLDSFVKKPETIQVRIIQFQNNISSLADLNLTLKNQPLELDYFTVTGSKNKQEDPNSGFFEVLSYRFTAFIASFYEDYNAVGNTYSTDKDTKPPINVWVSANDLATSGYASGRDQMTVIKRLIDDEFVKQKEINVNLRLVDSSSTLTQAILAKQGPDVALVVPSQTPINLAMRDTLVDISKLNGFDTIKDSFYTSAFIPYEFNGGVYGMPETQVFWMTFYRKDILGGLGVNPPETWSDFYKVANVIMKNHMEIGVPENLQLFETFLMQNGANMYNEKQTATALQTQEAINAFTEWTNIYSDYSFPLYFDPFSRFRTGEMPIVLMPYTFYNQLAVGAPEIADMWGMLPLPAREINGKMSRISSSAGTCSIILKSAKDKESCFDFIKWWVSADIQAQFGIEIESVLGPAARYNTANIEAFRRLPWSSTEQKLILEQWKDVSAIYNVPGNYYVSRCLTNAFRRVVMYYDNPRETLLKYNMQINSEITRKRLELGLPIK